MSRTERRRWLAIGLTTFALRAGAALLTERHPLFPSYYYQDAVLAEKIAAQMTTAWSEGRRYESRYSAPQRAHAFLLAVPYALVGPRPLVGKLLNAGLGALSAVLLGLAVAPLFSGRAGMAASLAVAAWPSHVFYTSQNFKEAATFACFFAAMRLALPALEGAEKPGPRGAALLAAALVLCGLFRSYVLLAACIALAAGALAACRRDRRAAFILAAALAAPACYKGAASLLFTKVLPAEIERDQSESNFIRESYDYEARETHRPLSPGGITAFRSVRQKADREFALKSNGREIGTQLFPDARFETWGDVAAFLPRSAAYVLFMPLPWLYPMEGKPGRWLAAGENVILLLVGLSAFVAVLKGRAPTPGRATLLLFFGLMLGASALMEFDLGSASRHKLLYLPCLFPFAAEALLRRRSAA